MGFALYFLSYSIRSLSSKEVKLSKRLKKELQKKLIEGIERFQYSYQDRIDLIDQFPKELKLEIACTMHKGFASRFSLFQREEDNFLLEILPLMQNLSIKGLQTIYSHGESSTKIYFLLRGRTHFLLSNDKTVFLVHGDGAYFGDAEVLLNIPRLNKAFTATECRFLIMGIDIIKKIHSYFPNFYAKMKDAAMQKFKIIQKSKAEMKLLLGINKYECLSKSNIKRIKDEIKKKIQNVYERKTLFFNENHGGKIAQIVKKLNKTNKQIQECKGSLKSLTELVDFCILKKKQKIDNIIK